VSFSHATSSSDCGPYGLVEMHFENPDSFSTVQFALYPPSLLGDQVTIPPSGAAAAPPPRFDHHPLFPLRATSAPPTMAAAYPHHTVGPKQGIKIAKAQQRLQQANPQPPMLKGKQKEPHVAERPGPFEEIISQDEGRPSDVDDRGVHDEDYDSERSELGQECTPGALPRLKARTARLAHLADHLHCRFLAVRAYTADKPYLDGISYTTSNPDDRLHLLQDPAQPAINTDLPAPAGTLYRDLLHLHGQDSSAAHTQDAIAQNQRLMKSFNLNRKATNAAAEPPSTPPERTRQSSAGAVSLGSPFRASRGDPNEADRQQQQAAAQKQGQAPAPGATNGAVRSRQRRGSEDSTISVLKTASQIRPAKLTKDEVLQRLADALRTERKKVELLMREFREASHDVRSRPPFFFQMWISCPP
jgi:hypothetical protein